MFYDLNIKLNKPTASDCWRRELEEIFTQLLEYGYRGVAVTVEIDDIIFASKKEKSKKKSTPVESDLIPTPIDVKLFKDKFPKLNIYKRINILVESSENFRKVFQSKHIKLYDIISCQPQNENVLKSLVQVNDVDIISYNPESRFSMSMNRKWYNQLVSQNVFFEIMYGPAINSQTARRNLITLCHKYHAFGKGKNIIVTSGIEQAHHLRGPYDVMNFNLIFGLSEEQARKAISRNCERVLLKSKKQRLNTGMFEMSYRGSPDTENIFQNEISDDIQAVEVMEE